MLCFALKYSFFVNKNFCIKIQKAGADNPLAWILQNQSGRQLTSSRKAVFVSRIKFLVLLPKAKKFCFSTKLRSTLKCKIASARKAKTTDNAVAYRWFLTHYCAVSSHFKEKLPYGNSALPPPHCFFRIFRRLRLSDLLLRRRRSLRLLMNADHRLKNYSSALLFLSHACV